MVKTVFAATLKVLYATLPANASALRSVALPVMSKVTRKDPITVDRMVNVTSAGKDAL